VRVNARDVFSDSAASLRRYSKLKMHKLHKMHPRLESACDRFGLKIQVFIRSAINDFLFENLKNLILIRKILSRMKRDFFQLDLIFSCSPNEKCYFNVHGEKDFFRFSIPIYLIEICFIEITCLYQSWAHLDKIE
jgi:hypothetical protein